MRHLEQYWKDSILKHVPHGEEGSLECTEEEAIILTRLLVKKGYAVCITGGGFDDDVNVSWLYAGSDKDLNWANYDNVAFFNVDYLEDYPQAYYEDMFAEGETGGKVVCQDTECSVD